MIRSETNVEKTQNPNFYLRGPSSCFLLPWISNHKGRDKTLMFDLRQELVEEILSRVRATSLKRLRSTCKLWNALFKDQRFTEKHFRKAPKQPGVIMLNDNRLVPTMVDLNVVPPSIKFEAELDLKDPHSNNSKQVDISEVFHCDGLLLCITNDNRPVVWNPF